MSKYAYIDKSKKTTILAEKCTASDIHKTFYCPDPNCKSIVHLCAFNSNKVKPYFKGNNHTPDCSFYNNSQPTDLNNYNTNDFSPDNLLLHLQKKPLKRLHSTSKTSSSIISKKYIHSIKSLYYLSINYPIDYEINGFKIKELICDSRTAFIYFKYISGIKLVKCKYYKYDTKLKNIYFKYFYSDNEYLTLKLSFINTALYNEIQKKFYKFSGEILIFADWRTINKFVETQITSSKQITAAK